MQAQPAPTLQVLVRLIKLSPQALFLPGVQCLQQLVEDAAGVLVGDRNTIVAINVSVAILSVAGARAFSWASMAFGRMGVEVGIYETVTSRSTP